MVNIWVIGQQIVEIKKENKRKERKRKGRKRKERKRKERKKKRKERKRKDKKRKILFHLYNGLINYPSVNQMLTKC